MPKISIELCIFAHQIIPLSLHFTIFLLMNYIFLITGFEEIEALATLDILRRGEVSVQTVSLTQSLTVIGKHRVPVIADFMFGEVDFSQAEMIILPGGTINIDAHDGLKELILSHINSGKRVAAICAAPMVLGGLGLLQGKRATCYPGMESFLKGAILQTHEAVVTDGLITTGRGPGLSFEFALSLLSQLKGKEVANEVSKQLLLHTSHP